MSAKPDGHDKKAASSLTAPGSNSATIGVKAGVWRLADLLALSEPTPAMLEGLRGVHQAARQVIDANMEASHLGRETMVRLAASVERQANQAHELQRRLARAQAGSELQDEIAGLREYLEEALAQIRRRLTPVQ